MGTTVNIQITLTDFCSRLPVKSALLLFYKKFNEINTFRYEIHMPRTWSDISIYKSKSGFF